MINKIAFCGTSGSGKTTLVKYVNEVHGYPWINGSSGEIISAEAKKELTNTYQVELGLGHQHIIKNSMINPSFGIAYQNAVLEFRAQQIKENARFVTDRSPIDNIAYFLTQCSSQQPQHICMRFIADAISLIEQELDLIIYIKPVQPNKEVEDNGSRVANWAYQFMVDAVFEKTIHQLLPQDIVNTKVRTIDFWDLQQRKDYLDALLKP
jgi:adenylate kinase